MATHSSTLALKIPWTEEPGRLVMGSQRVGYDRATSLSFSFLNKVNLSLTGKQLKVFYAGDKNYKLSSKNQNLGKVYLLRKLNIIPIFH